VNIFTILIIALGLSFDTFAVSISSGLKFNRIGFLIAIKIAIPLAFFQAFMPVLGWSVGNLVKDFFALYDHWIAFTLLFIIGAKMLYDGGFNKKQSKVVDPLHIPTLLLLSIATSIDALIVGLSFAFLEINILLAALIIGLITGVVAMLGLLLGKNAGKKLGKRAEIFGGIILIGIGVKILIEHLLSA